MPSNNSHAKHSSHDGRTNLGADHNNTHHRSPIGGNRPYNHKPYAGTTSREHNLARSWTDMRNSTGGLRYTKHDRDPSFSNSATGNRIHKQARNRGTTHGSTRANTSN